MFARRHFLENTFLSLLAIQVADLMDTGGGTGAKIPGGEIGRVMSNRRTVRRYSRKGITSEQFLSVLWAAQGVTDEQRGFRTAPSAGALYPLEVFAFTGTGTVKGMDRGVHRFRPGSRDLERLTGDDRRGDLGGACLGQMWIAQAPACLVISVIYERTMRKYGERGVRYADIESGCAAQNVFLMAEALGLAAGIVGAFDDWKVKALIGTEKDARPLLVMPVGHRA
jgi:SagB-type dehydrogenase family enzyme